MFCENCGAALPEGVKFCEQCGAKVASEVTAASPSGRKLYYPDPERYNRYQGLKGRIEEHQYDDLDDF